MKELTALTMAYLRATTDPSSDDGDAMAALEALQAHMVSARRKGFLAMSLVAVIGGSSQDENDGMSASSSTRYHCRLNSVKPPLVKPGLGF